MATLAGETPAVPVKSLRIYSRVCAIEPLIVISGKNITAGRNKNGVKDMSAEFRNEPLTDFSIEENAKAMHEAIEKVKGQLGREYPLVIGGERITTSDKLDSFNPANRAQLVGRFNKATKELAARAVETAFATFRTWKNVPATERAELLFRVAAIMRERKHELSAWMVYEVAKTWAEADGDTAEAIDFCEFYAREMLRYAGDQPLVNSPGEENALDYVPLGVGAVFPPWTFPGQGMLPLPVQRKLDSALMNGQQKLTKVRSGSNAW